jgi:hypothetical protein
VSRSALPRGDLSLASPIASGARWHGGGIVKHDHLLSGINERMNHATAD